MGIDDLADRAITEASGGQLQRVGICRALINQPRVLFGDEPTGALNTATSATILELFHDINRDGTTIILVTHDPTVAAHADRVLMSSTGKPPTTSPWGPTPPKATTDGLKTSPPSCRHVGVETKPKTPDLSPGRAASPPGVVAFRPRMFDHA